MMFKVDDCFWDGKEIVIVTGSRISGNKVWGSDENDVTIEYNYIRTIEDMQTIEVGTCTHEQISELRYLGNIRTKMWDQLPENIK